KVVISINHNLNALRAKEKSQEEHLENYQQELTAINNVEQKLKELERRVKLNEENYTLYFGNREEARIHDAMDNQKLANISVVEPAHPPIKPVKPKKLLNIILSIILGGVAGLGVAFFSEYCDHRFNNPEDLKKHLGTPVLASIHEME
ncbi:MAG: lipopolysaccharide biosynthesis protein, partial [Deltaproteobacteria bacterium]|nr:lipopolysaccharide biosynthesis protein [Deltaproteobacteria bacterium]